MALPDQIVTWMHYNIGSGLGDGDVDKEEPQFLYALKDTAHGDRQLVWEGGGGGRGIVAVVDFGGPKLYVNSRWRSWGVTTMLKPPIALEALRSDPTTARRFSPNGMKALQGLPSACRGRRQRLLTD